MSKSILLIAISWACVVTAGCNSSSNQSEPVADQTSTKPVSLKIEFPNEREPIQAEFEWRDGLTVFGLLELACESTEQLDQQSTGAGETRFVRSIGGVENSGGSGKNWIYYVNGKLADVGSGVKKLKPGDQVLWSFGEYR